MEEDEGRRKGEAENKRNKLSIEELSGLGTWLGWEGPGRLRAWEGMPRTRPKLVICTYGDATVKLVHFFTINVLILTIMKTSSP